MEKKPQYVCLFCQYSTPNRNAMKAHFKTRKHYFNKNMDIDIYTAPKVLIEEIIKKNDDRRYGAGADKNINSLLYTPKIQNNYKPNHEAERIINDDIIRDREYI